MFILLIPMILVGLLFNGKLYHVVYGYYFLAQLTLLYYTITITSSVNPSSIFNSKNLNLNSRKRELQLFLILLFGIIFLNFLYPIRGWDALQYYFPNALFYYLQDDIPSKINPFSLYPTHKPPVPLH